MKLFEAMQADMLHNLFQICQEILDLDQIPEVHLITDQPFITGGDKKSFGVFDGESIKVVAMNRHPMDVMRTLAHEIVHWKQKESGAELDGSDGSDAENEANAMAGVIMRRFGERYPDYFLESLPR